MYFFLDCTILATMKPLLLSPPPTTFFPINLSSISVGNILCGYIYKIEDFGVIVHFGGNVHGLVLKSELNDFYVKNISDYYELYQTVMCSVLEIDVENKKLLLSLKLSKLTETAHGDYINSMLKEKMLLLNNKNAEESLINYKNYPIGSVVQGTVIYNKEYGVILNLGENVTGLALKPYHIHDVAVEIGFKIDCCVLDIDTVNQVVYVSLRKEFIINNNNKDNNKISNNKVLQKTINNKESVNSVVLYKKDDDTMLLSLPSFNNVFTITSLVEYNILHSKYNNVEIGSTVPVVILNEMKGVKPLLLVSTIESDFMKENNYINPKKRKRVYSMEKSRPTLQSKTIEIGKIYKAKILALYPQHV